QAMDFRAKQTESKIVGQFYRAKTTPIRNNMNKALDEIAQIHKAELEHNQVKTMDAASYAQTQIPISFTWFAGAVSFLFFCLSLVVIRVLSQRSRQLAERSRLYNEAQKAILSRDEVIAAVSYDFVEPLMTIAQAARTQSEDSSELIQSAVGVIEDRVRDISDQTKADAGILSLRLEQLALDAILDEAKLMMQPLAKQKEIRLDFTPVNPPVLAFFDTERVLRVLTNLVGNAIKFSPKFSKVTIKVRSDQQYVYVSVKDGGSGISEKQLPILFDNFWQARKTADQGAGVGLAVVKTVVTAHGGVVTAESHSNGSTFTFTLPRRRPVGFHQRAAAAPVVKIAPRSSDIGL
ncbi:MAG: HAMP domain-containing histidine kinase, partial [Bdellovibrio sp.]|nr:HAMP domain-containing histidine kinase [Bdellovibrio sp.]